AVFSASMGTTHSTASIELRNFIETGSDVVMRWLSAAEPPRCRLPLQRQRLGQATKCFCPAIYGGRALLPWYVQGRFHGWSMLTTHSRWTRLTWNASSISEPRPCWLFT